MDYDVFISHASEDKEDVARPLAAYLKKQGLSVWLDEFELTLGDSLRRTIDRGLSKSRFGVVILSKEFFSKEWPNRELDGLVAKEENIGKVILPVWHNLSRDEILKFSPTLADKLAVSTSRGIRYVAKQIINAVARATKNGDIKHEFREKDFLKELRRKMIAARSPIELRKFRYELEEYLSKYPNSPEARFFAYQIKGALNKEFIFRKKRHKRLTQSFKKPPMKPPMIYSLISLILKILAVVAALAITLTIIFCSR